MVCCRNAGSSLYPCTCDCTGLGLLRSIIRWPCTHNCMYRAICTGQSPIGSLLFLSFYRDSPISCKGGSLLGLGQDDCCWVDEVLASWEVLRALRWQCGHFLGICYKQCASGHHHWVEQRLLPTSRSYLYICTAGSCLLQAVIENDGFMQSSQICHVSGLTGWQSACTPPNCRWIHSRSWQRWMRENSTLTSASYQPSDSL